MSGLPTKTKSERKPSLLSRNAHFARDPLQIIRCLCGTFEAFLASQRVDLFVAISVCLLLERRLILHDFVVTEYCFH